jgi:hypothetical protein
MRTWADKINIYKCIDCRKAFTPHPQSHLICKSCFNQETQKLINLPAPNKNIYSGLTNQDVADVKKWLLENRNTYEDLDARIIACTIFFRRHHSRKLDLKKYRIGKLIRESGAYKTSRNHY